MCFWVETRKVRKSGRRSTFELIISFLFFFSNLKPCSFYFQSYPCSKYLSWHEAFLNYVRNYVQCSSLTINGAVIGEKKTFWDSQTYPFLFLPLLQSTVIAKTREKIFDPKKHSLYFSGFDKNSSHEISCLTVPAKRRIITK